MKIFIFVNPRGEIRENYRREKKKYFEEIFVWEEKEFKEAFLDERLSLR